MAQAHGDLLHGTVLAVQASEGRAIVSGDAVDSMPAMTMPYRMSPSDLKKVHVGDRITAVLNESTKPWTLSEVGIDRHISAVQPPSPIHDIPEAQIGDRVPRATLIDQQARQFTFDDFRGKNVVLGFIYTRCHDTRECPLTTAKFGELQRALQGRDVQLVEVTLDPDYDTPYILKKYAAQYEVPPNSNWIFGTGSTDQVLAFDAAFGLNPLADPRVGLIHGETLAVVDRTGKVHDLIYTNAWKPQEIVAEINAMDNRASNPIARLDLALSRAAVAICGNNVDGFDGFVDLLVVIVIFSALGWALWRLYRFFATRPA